MKDQTYRMAMLFDFYGDLLTDRQREFYDLYYNEDLSLGEIAENYGISRQGVRDVIVRAEAAMRGVEDKTHLIRRFCQSQEELHRIQESLDALRAMNDSKFNDLTMERLLDRIQESVSQLSQE